MFCKTLLIPTLLATFASTVFANNQIIDPEPSQTQVNAGDTVSISLNYSNSTLSPLSGLGLRIHYDSSQLNYEATDHLLTDSLQPISSPQNDSNDIDSDPTTDKYIVLAWVDFNSNWPISQLPTNLGELLFTVNDNFSDLTFVRFSSSSTAAGYGFIAKAIKIQLSTPGGW